jgi:hypothetical protein
MAGGYAQYRQSSANRICRPTHRRSFARDKQARFGGSIMCSYRLRKAERSEYLDRDQHRLTDRKIRNSPAITSMAKVDVMLVQVVTTLFDSNPLVLVSPSTWRQHQSRLEAILVSSSEDGPVMTQPNGSLRRQRSRQRLLDEAKTRSDRLSFRPAVAESTTTPRRQQMQDLHVSHRVCRAQDVAHVSEARWNGC